MRACIVTAADLGRTDTYLKADLTPGTCVIIEDNGRKSLRKILEAVRDAGGTLVYVLGVGLSDSQKREEALKSQFPELNYLTMSELFGGPLLTEFSRSLTRLKVQQYQRYFTDADRVLILLHNEPDPDAMASGLALRNVLRRTKQTAVIAALQGVTRPENVRMVNLLDIHVEIITPDEIANYERVAMVDVQPHYFAGIIDRVDLVIDHHPEQSGYSAVFKDIRAALRVHVDDPDGTPARRGREHLGAHRDGDALRDQVRHAVLQSPGEPGGPGSVLVSLSAGRRGAHPEDGGRGNHHGAAGVRIEGEAERPDGRAGVLRVPRGTSPREDFIPYVADFYLQLENVKWTIVAGIVNDSLVMSVRNLGYSRNAGEFVRKYFAHIGSAGGHRAMAKAVVPLRAFKDSYGNLQADEFTEKVLSLALEFLHEHQAPEKNKLVKMG